MLDSFSINSQKVILPQLITIEDGLSQGHVSAILQDKEGFIWFATKNGLNRYDGEHFEVFTHDPTDPYSISQDWVHSIFEYRDFLLIGSIDGTLEVYSKRINRFYIVPQIGESLRHTQSEPQIYLDSLDQFWIYSDNLARLIQVRFPADFWDHPHITQNRIASVNVKVFSEHLQDIVGLIDQGKGLLAIDDHYTFIKIDAEGNIERSSIKSTPDLDRKGTNQIIGDKLISFRLDTIYFYENGKRETYNPDFTVLRVEKDQATGYCGISVEDGFMLYLDEEIRPGVKKEDAFAIIEQFQKNIFTIASDRSGIIWAGTDGYGVYKIVPRMTQIQQYFPEASVYGRPYISEDGEIIVRNPNPHGVLYYPGETGKLQGLAKWAEIATEAQLFKDDKEDIWMVCHTEMRHIHIRRFKPPYREWEEFASWPCRSYGLAGAEIDRESKSLLVVCDGTLGIFSLVDQTLKTFDFSNLSSGERGYYAIAKTAPDHYWLGTPNGLIEIIGNGENYDFNLIQAQGALGGLLNNEVSSLLNDPGNPSVLWIGTKGGGLHRLETKTMEWWHLNSRNGLPNDVVYGVLNDDSGNLWMSTNKGIVRYDHTTGKIANFTRDDGMQSDEFNTYAYARGPDGKLYFGGIHGLNAFDPEDLSANTTVPPVWINGLEVNNQKILAGDSTGILSERMEYTTAITLPYSQNNITLQFVANEHSAPFKNQYRYYLEGAESPWIHQSEENRASYLNLNPGSYTFHVKGSNGDGIWNEDPTSLKIIILPPWYFSTIAWLMYGLLAILLVWKLIRFRINRLKLKHEIAMEHREAERLKELDSLKSRLYTNITHEFRTPLTVISGIADKMDGDPQDKLLIKRNSDQLINLVNQMLDLRKIEAGAMPLNLIQGDIVRFIRYLTETAKPMADNKGINLKFSSVQEQLYMDFDREKVTRVFTNLLSNAIKFTPGGGVVEILLDRIEYAGDARFTLCVMDNGIGISSESQERIFDRFYQADDSSTRKGEGTGIGLTLVKELLRVMGGEIDVKSAPGAGAAFTISIPVSTNAPMEKDVPDEAHPQIEFTPASIRNEAKQDLLSANGKPVVLLIEDNPDVIHYLVGCLKDAYSLIIAVNGSEGIDMAFKHIPEIIVSDVMMPEKDGLAVCETLKNDIKTSHIPIILLTAKADLQTRLEGLSRGADAYIAKPFNREELMIEMQKLLRLRETLRTRYLHHESLPQSDDPGIRMEDSFITTVRENILLNLDNPDFDVSGICLTIGMSRSSLHRKISALTGKSISDFQRSIRLQRAVELLDTTDMQVSEVAYEVGFRDPSYFSKAFSRVYGHSPSEHRKEV